MLKKKTKRGVDIKQTLGMKSRSQDPTWVLVVHKSRASLFLYERMSASLHKIRDLLYPGGRMRERDVAFSHPGREAWNTSPTNGRNGAGAARDATVSERGAPMQSLKRLVRRCAEWVEVGHSSRSFGTLVVVAESQCLGQLRAELKNPVRDRISAEHEKDYSWLTESELKQRLLGLIGNSREAAHA